jgi:hypothetical protein
MRPISLGWRFRDAESRATITRVAAISLDDAAGASFGRASVLLHPDAIIAIGRTAASRRNIEYECMLRGAEGAGEARLVMERTSVFPAPEQIGNLRAAPMVLLREAARLTRVRVPRAYPF